ncbi:hypothetical protein E4U42_000287 [Claviceps africana]|uniref:Uncharacterized protein n=1 Tax=Claviceps africana TaxID=83212 RepID=A0A8K0JAW3_9HYPO|nr:hypothetical protein E4U42_000287 [Claviceps africana]
MASRPQQSLVELISRDAHAAATLRTVDMVAFLPSRRGPQGMVPMPRSGDGPTRRRSGRHTVNKASGKQFGMHTRRKTPMAVAGCREAAPRSI